jgi:hypothetical protein
MSDLVERCAGQRIPSCFGVQDNLEFSITSMMAIPKITLLYDRGCYRPEKGHLGL